MKLWSPLEFFHKNMSHEQLPFMWSTLRDSSMGTILKYFWKTHKSVQSAWIFCKNMSHEQLLLMWSTFRDSSMGTKLKIFEKLMQLWRPPEVFSQKHVSRTITFHVIHMSWFYDGYKVEIFFEKLMKLWSPPEFINKIMSHEQSPFMWSTFRDSIMGTKLQYFWQSHESV